MTYDLSLTAFHQPRVDIDGGGDFSLSGLFLRFNVTRPVSRRATVGLSLRYDADDYDFSRTDALGDAVPWNDVRRFGFGFPLFARLENNWSLGLSPSIDWLQEKDADAGDSLAFGVTAFAFKSFARDRSIGLGAGLFRTVDDDTEVFPFVAVDWRFNDRWRLANPFEADVLGPAGLELSYRFNDRWQLGGGGVYRSFKFRLNDTGPSPNGIGENKGTIAFLRLQRLTERGIDLDFYVGATLNGQFDLRDTEDREIAGADYDTAPFLAVTASTTF